MSINYCPECEHIVEGNTVTFQCPGCDEKFSICYCGAEVIGLCEDAPDPSLDKFRQIADQVGK